MNAIATTLYNTLAPIVGTGTLDEDGPIPQPLDGANPTEEALLSAQPDHQPRPEPAQPASNHEPEYEQLEPLDGLSAEPSSTVSTSWSSKTPETFGDFPMFKSDGIAADGTLSLMREGALTELQGMGSQAAAKALSGGPLMAAMLPTETAHPVPSDAPTSTMSTTPSTTNANTDATTSASESRFHHLQSSSSGPSNVILGEGPFIPTSLSPFESSVSSDHPHPYSSPDAHLKLAEPLTEESKKRLDEIVEESAKIKPRNDPSMIPEASHKPAKDTNDIDGKDVEEGGEEGNEGKKARGTNHQSRVSKTDRTVDDLLGDEEEPDDDGEDDEAGKDEGVADKVGNEADEKKNENSEDRQDSKSGSTKQGQATSGLLDPRSIETETKEEKAARVIAKTEARRRGIPDEMKRELGITVDTTKEPGDGSGSGSSAATKNRMSEAIGTEKQSQESLNAEDDGADDDESEGGGEDDGASTKAGNTNKTNGDDTVKQSRSGATEENETSDDADSASEPKKKASLMQKLKGEVKILTGKVKRDDDKVEEGRAVKAGTGV